MNRNVAELFDHLGESGVHRVLDDVLDRSRLNRLAAACGLKYPGMRVRSQAREKLVADLVRHAWDRADARRSIYRLLEKETRPAYRQWCGLDEDQRTKRLADREFLLDGSNLGLHLYFLSRVPGNGEGADSASRARAELLSIAVNGSNGAAPDARRSRQTTRLRKTVAELERKVQHLETQLARSREAEKKTKRDLIQRKGDLAETRMLVERLRGELAANQTSSPADPPPRAEGSSEESLSKLNRAVRKLASEQRAMLRKLEAPAPAGPEAPDLSPIVEQIESLHKELTGLRRDSRKERKDSLDRMAGIGAELNAAMDSLRTPARGRRPAPGETPGDERVGVFIDVQNMYYGARRLKGKLDFDALLEQAVGERRRIQATAYVVESKEIDQSGFIAMLRQRAIDVRRKTLQVRADGSMKGDWDMELALDVLDAAQDLDVVVLVSGDGDFTSLVNRVRQIGPRVEVLGFPRHTAKSLVEAADEFHALDRRFMIASEPAENPDGTPRRKRSRRQARAEPKKKS